MNVSGRVEAAFILLLLQAASWVLAGISTLPFGFGGERVMLLQGLLTILFGWSTVWLAVALLVRARRARGVALGLEWLCVVWSVLQWLLPISSGAGPVSLLMGLGLPLTVIVLLQGRRARTEFAGTR